MPTPRPRRSWTIALRDGRKVRLRPIAPEDKALIAASFERLSDESRYRDRTEGIRHFSALALADNRKAIAMLDGLGDTRYEAQAGAVELIIDLPPKRGMGVRLARALRGAALGTVTPAQTLAHRVSLGVSSPAGPPVQTGRSIRTIVVDADDAETGSGTLEAALGLAAALGTTMLHLVRAYGAGADQSNADAALADALRAARAKGLEAVTHAMRSQRVVRRSSSQYAISDEGLQGLQRGCGSRYSRPLACKLVSASRSKIHRQ